MSRKFEFGDQEAVHFVTFTIIHRLDVFIRVDIVTFFWTVFAFAQKFKGLEVFLPAFSNSQNV
jgi:putative transposase